MKLVAVFVQIFNIPAEVTTLEYPGIWYHPADWRALDLLLSPHAITVD